MRILCLPINYGCDEETVRLVRCLAATETAPDMEVVVVDNTERADAIGLIRQVDETFDRARVVRPGENLGYFGAANWALREHLLDRSLPDWVMVCNVDLRIEDASFFSALSSVPSDVGVVGPAIWSDRLQRSTNPQYEERPAASKMRRLARIFANPVTMNLYFLAAYAKYALRRTRDRCKAALRDRGETRESSPYLDREVQIGGRSVSEVNADGGSVTVPPSTPRPVRHRPGLDDAPRRVYSVHGSCMLFSRAYFEAGGNLEYPCFLFGEEIYVAETCRRLGLGVVYHPGIRVLHDDHATTGVFRSGRMAMWHAESAAFTAKEWFGESE